MNTTEYAMIVATRVSTKNDASGNPRALYIVTGLHENAIYGGNDRLAIIEEVNGFRTVLEQYPTARKIEDIYTTPQEYNRWIMVAKNDRKIRDQEALEKYEEERANQ